MKIHTNMPKALKPFFIEELEIARNYLSNKNFTASWHHLERAHILGQPYPYHHTLVHWKMFLFGIRIKDLKEIVGQISTFACWWNKIFCWGDPSWQYRRSKCATASKNGDTS